jgi:hypothetical protein
MQLDLTLAKRGKKSQRVNHDAEVSPAPTNRFAFCPAQISEQYSAWPKINELWAESPSNGLMEKRGSALIDIGRKALEDRMRMYFDLKVDWSKLKALKTGLTAHS